MSKLSIRLTSEELRSIDSASINGTLQIVGSTFTKPIILLKLVNDSDTAVTVSYDGVTDHDYVPANGFALYDANANRYRDNGGMQFDVGSGVYVRGSAGTGNFYVVTFYAG